MCRLAYRRESPSRRLSLVCAFAKRQRVVLASPCTAGNRFLLILLILLILISYSESVWSGGGACDVAPTLRAEMRLGII